MAVLLSVAFAAHPAAAAVRLSRGLSDRLDSYVAQFHGSAGVVVGDTTSGYRYSYADDRVFGSASLYKLMVMIEAYRQDAAHLLSLDQTTVEIGDDDTGPDGWYTPVGAVLTVREAVERMITLSDNSPAQALLRLLATRNVNATATALGLRDTRINNTLPEAERTAPYNTTTARDMEKLFAGLLAGSVIGTTQSNEMIEVLRRQKVNDRLPSGLPAGAAIAHKTGNLGGLAHDAGIVFTPAGPRIVVLLTGDYASYDDVLALARQLAGDAYSAAIDRLSATMATLSEAPSSVEINQPIRMTLWVVNTSTYAWGDGVRLGAHWRARDGRYLLWDAARAWLPALAPGQAAPVATELLAPTAEGSLVLEWEVVDEGVAWSGDKVALALSVTNLARANSIAFTDDGSAQAAAERAHNEPDGRKPRPQGPLSPVAPRPTAPTDPWQTRPPHGVLFPRTTPSAPQTPATGPGPAAPTSPAAEGGASGGAPLPGSASGSRPSSRSISPSRQVESSVRASARIPRDNAGGRTQKANGHANGLAQMQSGR